MTCEEGLTRMTVCSMKVATSGHKLGGRLSAASSIDLLGTQPSDFVEAPDAAKFRPRADLAIAVGQWAANSERKRLSSDHLVTWAGARHWNAFGEYSEA